MPRPARRTGQRIALVALALACAAALTGCNQPPALTKAELDAARMPAKHPKVAPELAKDCRTCHREQPAIRK